jgi:hypothetical protein
MDREYLEYLTLFRPSGTSIIMGCHLLSTGIQSLTGLSRPEGLPSAEGQYIGRK